MAYSSRRMLTAFVVVTAILFLIIIFAGNGISAQVTAGSDLLLSQPIADLANDANQASVKAGTPLPEADQNFRSNPIMFIENAGQWDGDARFQVWGGAGTAMWLAEDAIWITVMEPEVEGQRSEVGDQRPDGFQEHIPDAAPRSGVNIKLSFPGANPHPKIETIDPLDTTISYFYGNDPNQWRPNVSVWSGVRYVDLWPGVDLEVGSEDGRLVQRFVAKEGEDVSGVRIQVEGSTGIALGDRTLTLATEVGEVDLTTPLARFVYQVESLVAGGVEMVEVRPEEVRGEMSSQADFAPKDNPEDLDYSTFLGGSVGEIGFDMAMNGTGSVYVTGWTESSNFPTTAGVFDGSLGGDGDAFVVKLNPDGAGLVYAAFLGGGDGEWGSGIAVDGTGSAYVTGGTLSGDFPVTANAFDRSHNGDWDAFVAKLTPAGNGLDYATFLGGDGSDEGYAITVDGTGNAYVTGDTLSGDFPTTTGAFDRGHNSSGDAFVARLNLTGSALDYATFLGGDEFDYAFGIAVDSAGSAYVTGRTQSQSFPTTSGAFDESHSGDWDAYVAKLNPTGSALTYATFLGGDKHDGGNDIAVDGMGSAYVTGRTESGNFPTTVGAYDTNHAGGQCGSYPCSDGFVIELNPNGSGLAYATFLGGDAGDGGYGIAVDGAGGAYVMGRTESNNFPTTTDAFDRSHNGDWDAFVARFNPTGSGLGYATLLGGSDFEWGYGIALDSAGSAYVTGRAESSDFPTTSGAFDRTFNGGDDAFVSKLAMGATESTPTPTATPTPTVGTCVQPPAGLVSWWPGDGDAKDYADSNDGVLRNGATYASGKSQLAFSFNNASEVRVEHNDNLNLQALTIEGWVYPTAVDGQFDIIVNKEAEVNWAPETIQYELSIRGTEDPGSGTIPVNHLAFYFSGVNNLAGDLNGWVDGGGPIPLDAWTHVALTFDGSTAQTYINGTPTRTLTGLSGSIHTSSGPLKIGARADLPLSRHPNDRFNGRIDELSLYNRALSSSEIQSITTAESAGKCKTGQPTPTPVPACLAEGKVDVVFAMDTSGSMDDEFRALCNQIDSIVAELQSRGVTVNRRILGITQTRQCATQTVRGLIPGGIVNHSEDWGPAVTDLSGGYTWQPGYTRLIITMSDEGPEDGNPVHDPGEDRNATNVAISAARANNVIVSPLLGSGYPGAVAPLAQDLADSTGGQVFKSTDPAQDLADAIIDMIGAAACTPIIERVTPTCDVDANTWLTILGSNFQPGAQVSIGGLPARDVTIVNPTEIRARIDTSLPPGVYDVTITNPPPPEGMTYTKAGAITVGPCTGVTPTPPLPTPTATPDFPACTISIDKQAFPSTARIDGQVGVTLKLEGDCPSEVGAALDVALVIDRSSSMCGDKLNQAQAAGDIFLQSMAFPPDQASVISFANTALLHSGLTGTRTQVQNALYNILCGGFSRIDAGLDEVYKEMSGPRRVAGHTPAIILLTDGNPEGAYAEDVRAVAQQITDAGIQLFTIGLGDNINAALLRDIATQPDYYYQSPTPEQLALIYTRLAGDLRNVPAMNVNITDVVGSDFEIVPNSFSGAATPQVNGDTLSWHIPRLDDGVTEVSFRVKPKACGTFPVNQTASASYDDNRGDRHIRTFSVPEVTIDGCEPDQPDIFIRDNDRDTGQVPTDRPWWASPDIWIRHANDGVTQHQNPQAGQRNYFYARVWNRGATTVNTIDLSFYYANPSLGLSWPNDWNELPHTRRIASIAPGQSAIVSIPWDIPNITGHFCLFVRIISPDDPIRDNRVPWENNIGQRNLHIIDYPQPQGGLCELNDDGLQVDRIAFDVVNTLNTSSMIDLQITAADLDPIAEVRFEPGPLGGRWASLDGLIQGTDGRLLVTSLPATVYGVRLNPNELRTVHIEVAAPGNSRFTVGLTELVRGKVVGGNSYERFLPSCFNLPLILQPNIQPCPRGRTYTLDADFDEGFLINLNHNAPNNHQLQLNDRVTPLPFIWIALSGRGTVAKIDTETGEILGEYLSSPHSRGRNPSRTTVDLNGNVWVGNRNESSGGKGSVVHIGLSENNQCLDRNGNGVIDTSTGLGDVRPWPNPGGVDNNGGVASAEDECVIAYQRVNGTNVRSVAVDPASNDVWVGGLGNRIQDLIDDDNGAVLTTINPSCGGYGGLVDGHGILWSASGNSASAKLLQYDPTTDIGQCINMPYSYGLGLDAHGNIWNARCGAQKITKLSPDGTIVGDFSTPAGTNCPTGLAVSLADNNIWIANRTSKNVTRLDNDGNLVAVIPVGDSPTGVAVDADGKMWVTNYGSNNAMRIDPTTNTVDLTVYLGSGAAPYNYSDMTGSVVLGSPPQGSWNVIYDSGANDTEWGTVSWTSIEPPGTNIKVRARSANTRIDLGNEVWVEVRDGVPFNDVFPGRYLQVEVQLTGVEDGATPVLYDLTIQPRCKQY